MTFFFQPSVFCLIKTFERLNVDRVRQDDVDPVEQVQCVQTTEALTDFQEVSLKLICLV